MGKIQGDIEYLQPLVRQSLMHALAELGRAGIDYDLTSGYRSAAEQQGLVDEFKAGVPGVYHPAAPGQSRHQLGTAIDLVFAPGQTSTGRAILARYGFQFTGGRTDPVHYDYVGTGTQVKPAPVARVAPAPSPPSYSVTATPVALAPWNQGESDPQPAGTPIAQAPWNQVADTKPLSRPVLLAPIAAAPWNAGTS